MTRRILSVAAPFTVLFAMALIAAAQAAEMPVVLQPTDSAFSAAERTAFLAGISDLDSVLRQGYPVPTRQLAGWTNADFATFAAGYIRSEGYETFVVEGPDGTDASRLWVLVGIPVETRIAWAPVEIRPDVVGTSSRLGLIPWVSPAQNQFEASYLSYAHVVQLLSHPAPTVRILAVGRAVVDEPAALHATSSMSSTIIAYVWTVEGDETVYVETSVGFRYTFPDVGDCAVSVVVYDRWGGRATDSETVRVLAEGDCGCG